MSAIFDISGQTGDELKKKNLRSPLPGLDSFEEHEGTTLCLDFLIKMEAILIYGLESFMVCSISVHIGWSSGECLFVQG